jgi:ribose 5-phosphate isomerase B
VSRGEFGFGVLVCGTGIGLSIAANKFPGVRAALCLNEFMARAARGHNNANVLCLGARVLEVNAAIGVVAGFFSSGFEGGRHERRVSKIAEIEKCSAK